MGLEALGETVENFEVRGFRNSGKKHKPKIYQMDQQPKLKRVDVFGHWCCVAETVDAQVLENKMIRLRLTLRDRGSRQCPVTLVKIDDPYMLDAPMIMSYINKTGIAGLHRLDKILYDTATLFQRGLL